MPGSPPTLQKGMRTAAFRLLEGPGRLRALMGRSETCLRAHLRVLSVDKVSGFVKDTIALYGLEESELEAMSGEGFRF